MFKNLISFSDYETLGIATTILFFAAFAAITLRVVFLRKSYTKKMEELPLHDGSGLSATNDDDKD